MNHRRFIGALLAIFGFASITFNSIAQQGMLWSNKLDGGLQTEDRPMAIARDASGNFFVGGYTVTASSGTDIFVLKQGPDGQLSSTWPDQGYGVGVRRYNGIGNYNDNVAAMTTDAAGNLYVAGTLGRSGNATTAPDDDACVLKYDVNGNLALVIRLTPISFDTGVALHVAASGRIYLLARSTGTVNGLSAGYIYLYEANGTLSAAWPNTGSGVGVRRLPLEAQSFQVADDGSVYVLGRQNPYVTYVDNELTLTKLSANGSGVWTNYYAGPIAGSDTAVALALAPDGEVVALGNAPGVGTGPDYLLWRVKADGTPSTAWPDIGFGAGVRRYDGTNRPDISRALKIDSSGNTYVTGSGNLFPYNNDFVTWKLDAQGNPSAEWPDVGFGPGLRVYRGPTSSSDDAFGLGVDQQGNVFVTGRGVVNGTATTPSDIVTVAYARTGEQLWRAAYSAGTNTTEVGLNILVDDARGVYVAGTSFTTSPSTDIVTLKYYHNTAPVASVPAVTLAEDGSAVVSLTGYDREGDAFTASVTALPGHGDLTLAGSDLLYSPALNFNGSDSFSFVLNDGVASSAVAVVPISVTPVNDVPVLLPGSLLGNTLEDTATVFTFADLLAAAGASDVDGDVLSLLIESVGVGTLTKSGSAVVPGVTLVQAGESLVWTPPANVNGLGLSAFVLRAKDSTTTSADSLAVKLDVTAVNDAPSFALSSTSYTLPKNAGATIISGLATSILAGPANEAGQTVTFQITNNNAALFSVQPALASNGTLTFTPKKGVKGQAVLTVIAKDNGGTANGGVDSSAAKTFTIIAK